MKATVGFPEAPSVTFANKSSSHASMGAAQKVVPWWRGRLNRQTLLQSGKTEKFIVIEKAEFLRVLLSQMLWSIFPPARTARLHFTHGIRRSVWYTENLRPVIHLPLSVKRASLTPDILISIWVSAKIAGP